VAVGPVRHDDRMRGRQTYDPARPHESRRDYWGVVLDAPDPPALIRFYADLLEWRIVTAEPDHAIVGPPDGVTYLAVQRSPTYEPPAWPNQPGRQQMMLHLDFEVDDLEAAVAHAEELGAELAEFQPQDDVRVMLDPVGHPFCLYVDR
jgi:catechol 2,3-dioxygenase-like lactoylglutathione lyase family enzyme